MYYFNDLKQTISQTFACSILTITEKKFMTELKDYMTYEIFLIYSYCIYMEARNTMNVNMLLPD